MTLNEYITKLQEIANKDNNGNKILLNNEITEYSSFDNPYEVDNIEINTEAYNLNSENVILIETRGTYIWKFT